ncbi:methylmalonyl-CoA mutase family protein [Planococcus salinus]|uniref:Methylmalonyl-CoA mutase n=1 Tax=Planococcus salinus TaxID=1848460 RepID=A0A3M8PDW4_9BACL|nr:methylmalonyl-CoA mutase family protein [Planococcus salinus]RNF41094.1 methylmalonyl-CoA mutase [Planococcus salinus]
MAIDSMKKTKFSERTYEEWQKGAEAALKGKSLDSLKTQTIEGITLEPLYTKDMLQKWGNSIQLQTAAVQAGKQHAQWLAAQEVNAESAEEFLAAVENELSKGSDVIVFTGSKKYDWTEAQFRRLAELIIKHPIYFKLTRQDQDILRVFDYIDENDKESVRGVIQSEEEVSAPGYVRTQLIDTIPVHHAGGTAIHELGVALSMLAEKMDAGSFADTADNLWVRFAVDTKFFQEIAKLRAFRVLWKAFCSAYGEDSRFIPIYTETSVRSYSKLDPYVNLLRAGNATFSAVLGATDVHTVHPHDFLTTPTAISRRIARNVQLVIKEEAHVSHVLDPSAGSYFIETLTKQYVDAAWNYFLEIEKIGGYSQAMKSGWLTDDIQAKWVERERDVATRKASLIGTNIYANPQEAVADSELDDGHLEYITAKRLALPFEKLRAQSRERILKTAIIHVGPLKEVKAKSDFVNGFLAVGGIEPLISPEMTDAEKVNRYLSDEQIDYAVLCGSESALAQVIPGLETSAAIDVAGKFTAQQLADWEKSGVQDHLYSGKHLVEKLEQILSLGKEAL